MLVGVEDMADEDPPGRRQFLTVDLEELSELLLGAFRYGDRAQGDGIGHVGHSWDGETRSLKTLPACVHSTQARFIVPLAPWGFHPPIPGYSGPGYPAQRLSVPTGQVRC